MNDWDFSIVAPSTNMPKKTLTKILDDVKHPITILVPKKDGTIEEKANMPGILHHIREEYSPIFHGKQLFIYDPELKYHRRDVGDLEKNISACLQLKGIYEPNTIKKAIENLTHHAPFYPFVEGVGTLNLINGVYDIKSGFILPHKKGLYDYIIRTPYIPQETTELDALLAKYGNTEAIDVLAKCLWQRAWIDTVKELTVFYGDKDTGKTTVGELIQATLDGDLISKSNTGRELLDAELTRFGIAPLEHKLFNLGDDLPDKLIKNSGRINVMVGSVHHQIEQKGVDSYAGVITVYHLFTTNNLPPLDDDDNVIWSKIRLVEFKNTFTRGAVREQIFTNKIKQQLLVKAIEKLRSWLTVPYINDQNPEDVRRIWTEATDDAEMFFSEMLVPNYVAVTKYDDIKHAYENWCESNDKTRHMKNLNKVIHTFYHRGGGTGLRYYTLDIKEPTTPKPKQTTVNEPQNVDEMTALKEITFPIDKHTKHAVKDTTCMVRGCSNKGEWHSQSYTLPHGLCDRHYQMLHVVFDD